MKFDDIKVGELYSAGHGSKDRAAARARCVQIVEKIAPRDVRVKQIAPKSRGLYSDLSGVISGRMIWRTWDEEVKVQAGRESAKAARNRVREAQKQRDLDAVQKFNELVPDCAAKDRVNALVPTGHTSYSVLIGIHELLDMIGLICNDDDNE